VGTPLRSPGIARGNNRPDYIALGVIPQTLKFSSGAPLLFDLAPKVREVGMVQPRWWTLSSALLFLLWSPPGQPPNFPSPLITRFGMLAAYGWAGTLLRQCQLESLKGYTNADSRERARQWAWLQAG